MNFTYALGWTLLHSLWQGLILAVMAIVALRLIPSRYSSARYLVSTAALGLMLVAGAGTFMVLLAQSGAQLPQALHTTAVETEMGLAAGHPYPQHPASALDLFYTYIQSNLQLITLAWVVGVTFFSLRIGVGFWYLSRIRSHATPVGAVWAERLQQLCLQMGIRGEVSLAESAGVQSPFVIGYVKPLILIPVGMIGGLSTEQLETILLHELSHIRRADYLVNIIQSFIEAIFFFNPFVWIVSSMIRTEREHCCDDAVVRHGHALTYAQALATVEALRLNHTNLAMSLAGDKNQLLKRIKRIMERSVQHYSVKERIVPVILLVVGLACASWMTMTPEQQKPLEESQTSAKVVADTTKPGKTYSRKQIIRFDDQGRPHEQVIERYEDEDGRHEITLHEDFDFEMDDVHEFDMPIAIQALPAFDFHALAVPPVPDMKFEALEPMELHFAPVPPVMMAWASDTLKPGEYTFHYEGMNPDDWASFSNEFQARFKEQFADFYKEHSKEMESMMKEMAKEYERNSKEYKVAMDFSAIKRHADELAEHQAEWAREHAERSRELAEHQAQWTIEYANRDREAAARIKDKAERDRVDQEYDIQERVREQVAQTEEQVNAMKENMAKFGEAVKAELVKDGYLKKDEAIKSMNWDSAGDITINGKKIKDRDRAKYNGIHDKFFKKDSMLRIEE